MSKKLVGSNYNRDLEWLKMTHDYGFSADNTIIYDRSSIKKNWSHLGKTISSHNIGGNQYDVLRFIIENYDDLPDISIFIKGNLFSKSEENYKRWKFSLILWLGILIGQELNIKKEEQIKKDQNFSQSYQEK